MFEQLRQELRYYLARHQVGVLSTAVQTDSVPTGAAGVVALPVRYNHDNLFVHCLVPRWSDVAYHLETEASVLFIVPTQPPDPQRWLQYLGRGKTVERTGWPELDTPLINRYVVVHLTPQRIDLIDEHKGWGARQTLDI